MIATGLATLFAHILTTSERHPVAGTLAMLAGFALVPLARRLRLLLTRQPVAARIEQGPGDLAAIRAEAERHRIAEPGRDVPTIRRQVRAVYQAGGQQHVRTVTIDVEAGDPSPATVIVWYHPDDPGAATALHMTTGSTLAALGCALAGWAGTMLVLGG